MLNRSFMVLLFLTALSPVFAESVTVEKVLAGDLLALSGGENAETLRIYGIDAPEQNQAFAGEAKAFVTEQIKDKEIEIERLTVDSLGVPVVRVMLTEDSDLAHLLLQEGLAWWDRENAPDDSKLKKFAAEAIAAEKGIWTDALALAPWDWRKSHGGEAYTYSIAPEPEPMPVIAKVEEERPKELKLKGDYVVVSNDMTNMLQTFGVNEDVNGILKQHGVMWATDANGNALGLTADVNSIPGAAALGLRQGDILTSVNGQPVTNMDQAMGVAGSLYLSGQGKTANIKVIRGGRPVNISVPIPKF